MAPKIHAFAAPALKCGGVRIIFGTNHSVQGKDATLSFTQESPIVPKRSRSKRAPPKAAELQPSPLESGLAKVVTTCLEDAKAEDIVGLDLTGRTTLADFMIIATGRSSTHVGAIAEKVVKACRDAGLRAPRIEGQPVNDWVLLDAGDAIIHIFRPEIRQFYNLEKLWSAERPAESRALAN
jgi:ribosome-associated protein